MQPDRHTVTGGIMFVPYLTPPELDRVPAHWTINVPTASGPYIQTDQMGYGVSIAMQGDYTVDALAGEDDFAALVQGLATPFLTTPLGVARTFPGALFVDGDGEGLQYRIEIVDGKATVVDGDADTPTVDSPLSGSESEAFAELGCVDASLDRADRAVGAGEIRHAIAAVAHAVAAQAHLQFEAVSHQAEANDHHFQTAEALREILDALEVSNQLRARPWWVRLIGR